MNEIRKKSINKPWFHRIIYMSGGALLYALIYMTKPGIFSEPLPIFLLFVLAVVGVQAFLGGKCDKWLHQYITEPELKTALARLGALAIIFGFLFLLLLVSRMF
jgi:heme A synthase